MNIREAPGHPGQGGSDGAGRGSARLVAASEGMLWQSRPCTGIRIRDARHRRAGLPAEHGRARQSMAELVAVAEPMARQGRVSQLEGRCGPALGGPRVGPLAPVQLQVGWVARDAACGGRGGAWAPSRSALHAPQPPPRRGHRRRASAQSARRARPVQRLESARLGTARLGVLECHTPSSSTGLDRTRP